MKKLKDKELKAIASSGDGYKRWIAENGYDSLITDEDIKKLLTNN